MSTEIEIKDFPERRNGSPALDTEAEIKRDVVSPLPSPRLWRRRWIQLGAIAAVVLLIAAIVGNNLLARQYTPEAAVRSYLNALRSGDASGAWSSMEVSNPTSPAEINLTDASALRAALGEGRPDFASFVIDKTSNVDSSHAVVAATLSTSKGSRQVQLAVVRSGEAKFGLYPDWRVVVQPVLLTVALPKAVTGMTVDGQQLRLPAASIDIAVLPLGHRVVFNATPLLAEQVVTVDAFTSAKQTLSYRPQLTPLGTQQAQAAIKAYFSETCAKQTSTTQTSGCPQAPRAYVQYSGHWAVIGDPGQGLSLSADSHGAFVLGGHFQMVFAYGKDGATGTWHLPSGGAFAAQAEIDESQIRITTIAKATSPVGLDRPAGATDELAKQVVATAMAACARVSAEFVPDCPQAAPDIIIKKVHWKLNGDPTSGATVRFDGETGLLTVHGNFSMGVSYTWFGDARSRSSYNTAYDAYLFWDGQTLQLVTIEGS